MIDKELVVSMNFFEHFAQKHPEITGLEIHLKTGPNNELSYYRYDIIFHVRNLKVKLINSPQKFSWEIDVDSKSIENNCFTNSLIDQFYISDIPNDYLPPAECFDAKKETVIAMKESYQKFSQKDRGNLIIKLYELAKKYGYKILTRISPNNPHTFEVFGIRTTENIPCCISLNTKSEKQDIQRYANNPLLAMQCLVFPDEIRKKLQEVLPAYLIPSAIFAMPELPMTIRGKVDAKLLPPPFYHISSFENYVPPKTQIEKTIVNIWQDILRLDSNIQISVNHDFFKNLGGNSLLVFRVIRKINEALNVNLKIKEFIDHSTILSLAALIGERQANSMKPSETTKEPSSGFGAQLSLLMKK